MNAKQLGEKIAELKTTRSAIHQLGVTETRSLTDDEQTRYETISEEIRSLQRQEKIAIDAEQELAEQAIRSTKPLGREDNEQKRQRDLGKYSFLRAIQTRLNPEVPKPLQGIEREMHEEAETEARSNQMTIQGIGVPSVLARARNMEKRDNSITMPVQPEDGSAIMPSNTKYISLDDMLRDALMVNQLGATYFNDLVGNVDFVRMTERPLASWKPEVANLDKSNVKFGKNLSLSPKRIGTYTIHSLQFLRQTAVGAEMKIREELAYSIAEGVDKAAIYGDGQDNEPLGILNLTGANAITKLNTTGANGEYLTRGDLVKAIFTLMQKNVNGRNYGWLMNAVTAGKLADTVIAETSDRFIMEQINTLLNYSARMSNAVKATNVKGTSGATLSDLIFGAWENLYIAQWGGYDLIVDPYTLGQAGQIRIIIQAFADLGVYEPKAFVAFSDVKTA